MSFEDWAGVDLQGKVVMQHLQVHKHQVLVQGLSGCCNCSDFVVMVVAVVVLVLLKAHIHQVEIQYWVVLPVLHCCHHHLHW